MLLNKFSPMTGAASPNRIGVADGGQDQHRRAARGGVGGEGTLPVGQEIGKGAHPRRAVRDDGLAPQACGARTSATCCRGGRDRGAARARAYIRATIKDALTALWEASDRVCGKRLKVRTI